MGKANRLAAILKIEHGEEALIGSLILFACILEVEFIFQESAAFGLFLEEYGSEGLPYSYIVIAVVASFITFLYIKLGERVSFSRAVRIGLAFTGVISLAAWLGLKSPYSHSVSFFLPLLYDVSVTIGVVIVWQLAGRFFNFQQTKRLLPLLIGVPWLADAFGGLMVEPVVASIGVTNIFLLAAFLIGMAIWLVHRIMKTHLEENIPQNEARQNDQRGGRSKSYLRNPYVLLLFTYVILWWMAYYFLDTIFANRATAQFADVAQLSAFRGRLWAIISIIGFISSLLLSSRIIGRFGIRIGLLIESLFVAMLVGSMAVTGGLNGTVFVVFLLATSAKLVNAALGFSLSSTAKGISFQPLPDTIRGNVRATATGIITPVASGLAGLILLVLIQGFKFTYLGLSYIYLVIAAGLLIVIVLFGGRYVTALTQAISKRHLGEAVDTLADPASIALLKNYLHDPRPGMALFALNRLESLDPGSVKQALPLLLTHPAWEVRREAFSRVEQLKLQEATQSVRCQLDLESVPEAKEAGLRALGAVAEPGLCSVLEDSLHETDPCVLRGTLVGLLKYHESKAADQTLLTLLTSDSMEKRLLAAQVLGELDAPRFLPLYETLLQDPDVQVKDETLRAAAQSRLPALYPLLIEACESPETSRAASLALLSIGPEILPLLETSFTQEDAPHRLLLALPKVMGRIGGARSHTALQARLGSPDGELRSQVLKALSEARFRAKDPAGIYQAIHTEGREIAWVCAMLVDLENCDRTEVLSAALKQSILQARERVLYLLSFTLDSHSILQTRDAFLSGAEADLDYAHEILEVQLPSDQKPVILPLFEQLAAQDLLKRLSPVFPQRGQQPEERLQDLIGSAHTNQLNDWVRACAIYTAVQLDARSCLEQIREAAVSPEKLIQDTACWAIDTFQNKNQGGRKTMLSIIEKVLILKTVNMFSRTPDDVLADVADLLDEMAVPENTTIFNKGEMGDSMYIIVDGKVRVHSGDRLLNYLGESDVFGEMALLDPEPRLASVTTVEATRLFRLDRVPFFQLMSERPEVATGVIAVLTRRLRDRVRDISQLQDRIQVLESDHRSREPVSISFPKH
jgi:ATP:ADP antiporter, AAA family